MAGIKIVDLPAVGRDLAATDLFEISLAGGTGSRKITGQEIMNASKLSVNNTPVINGTSGRIFFQGSTNVLQQSSSLFWDETNSSLGIGTDTPSQPLTIKFAGQSGWDLVFFGTGSNTHNISGGNTLVIGHNFLNMQNSSTWAYSGTNKYFSVGVNANLGSVFGVKGLGNTSATSAIIIQNSSATELLRIWNDGAVGIGVGGTNAGYKLDVNGTARTGAFTSASSIAAVTSITASNADGFNLTGGTLRISAQGGGANATIGIFTQDQTTYGYNHAITFNSFNGLNTQTSGAATSMVRIRQTFQVASSATSYSCLLVDPTINQTGTANGITRGLFIDPTLTSAADFRAIETTRGNVLFATTSGNVAIGTTTALEKLQLNGGICFGTSNNATINSGIGAGNHTYLQFATLGVNVMRISANQNVLIGTTTDAGYKLDVNGTARVNSTATTGLTITQGASGDGIVIQNGGYIQMASTRFRAFSSGFQFQDMSYNTKVVLSMSGFSYFNSGANYTFGSITEVTSAIVNVDSTTKGFLPPRMTQTQRNAIASPAIGLEIYQTDATEGKYIYKSSGWTYIG